MKILKDKFNIQNMPIKSLIVMANPKTILNKNYCPKEIKDILIRHENLGNYIRTNIENRDYSLPEVEAKQVSEYFLNNHKPISYDYNGKYGLSESNCEKIEVETSCETSNTAAVGESLNETIAEEKSNDTAIKVENESDFTELQTEKINKLKQYRYDKSKEEKLKAYIIFNNEEMFNLVRSNPKNKEELLNVKGFGVKKVEKYGDAAVGKMTVGQELTKITDLRLFHNHMTIEPVLEIFGYFNGKAITRMRDVIFEEFANSEQYGLIFTYMWAFDQQSDWDYVEHVCDIFRKHNVDIYYAELVAPQVIRLQRNATENRLKNKVSKRDIEISNQRLINDNNKYRCVSNDGEIPYDNYIKIDNSNLSPETVAQIIKDRFGL